MNNKRPITKDSERRAKDSERELKDCEREAKYKETEVTDNKGYQKRGEG